MLVGFWWCLSAIGRYLDIWMTCIRVLEKVKPTVQGHCAPYRKGLRLKWYIKTNAYRPQMKTPMFS